MNRDCTQRSEYETEKLGIPDYMAGIPNVGNAQHITYGYLPINEVYTTIHSRGSYVSHGILFAR